MARTTRQLARTKYISGSLSYRRKPSFAASWAEDTGAPLGVLIAIVVDGTPVPARGSAPARGRGQDGRQLVRLVVGRSEQGYTKLPLDRVPPAPNSCDG